MLINLSLLFKTYSEFENKWTLREIYNAYEKSVVQKIQKYYNTTSYGFNVIIMGALSKLYWFRSQGALSENPATKPPNLKRARERHKICILLQTVKGI